MSDAATKDAGALFGDAMELLRANGPLIAIALVLLTALGVLSDMLGPTGQLFNLIILPMSLALQYEITLRALAERGLVELGGRRRLWALLGVNIVYGLSVFLGLILLLLPGLYLFVRWSVAVPVLIAEDAGVGEALSRSGEEIAGRSWPVAGAFMLIYLPWVAAFVALIIAEPSRLLSSVAANLLLNLGLVGGWCAAVAVYADGKDGNRLAQVFA